MQDIISIIIPVYNSEKYIEKTVQSVLDQSYKEFELLIVDDGSYDNSYQILKLLSKQDSRIHLFHQKNKGVSTARNIALDHATGKYIVFIDSDDYLPKDALKIRIEDINDNDLLITSFQKVDEYGNVIEQEAGNEPITDVICPACEVIDNLFYSGKYGYQGYLWTKLFRKEYIDQGNIRFNSDLAYNEDRLFVLQYLKRCNKVRIIENQTYYYVQRNNSKMGQMTMAFSENMMSDFKAFEIMKDLLPNSSVAKERLCEDEFFSANKWIENGDIKPEYKQYLIELQNSDIKYYLKYSKENNKAKMLIKMLYYRCGAHKAKNNLKSQIQKLLKDR